MPSSVSSRKAGVGRQEIIVPDLFEERGVRGLFTTKHIETGFGEIAALFGGDGAGIYMPTQKHTDVVIDVGDVSAPTIGDAVVTDSDDVFIGVKVADCVPVLLFDCSRKVAAAVHAGWRGTVQEILRKTIGYMKGRYRCNPADIVVGIGPAIGQCCYEVGVEVAGAVRDVSGEGGHIATRNGRHFVDLPLVNRLQALAEGISQENMWISVECTCCNPERFHSYRRSGHHAGRQGGFIGIKPHQDSDSPIKKGE